jgi:hypothetical protein
MTLSEVEGLLGGPAPYHRRMFGYVASPSAFFAYPSGHPKEKLTSSEFYQWRSSEAAIVVIIGDNGTVVCRYDALGPPHWRVYLQYWTERLIRFLYHA